MDFVVNHFIYHFILFNVLNTIPASIITDILFYFTCVNEFRFYDHYGNSIGNLILLLF